MKAIVTGGAGFIGSALVKKLIDLGYQVLVIDNLTYASQLSSLEKVQDSNLYSFYKADVADEKAMVNVVNSFQPSFIFHLAAETHVDRSIDSPESFIKTNILGTYSLLNSSLKYWRSLDKREKDQFRFLHVSTDEVFGDLNMEDPPFCESSNYLPSSPYSASKASSDHLARAWYRTYKLPVLISNCSNNYGPYQLYEKLIPLMIVKALNGEKLPIYGSGMQIRDWLYVEDHVEALIKVIQIGKIGDSYNIGGNSEKTNLEVVEQICGILDDLIEYKPKGIRSFTELISFVEDRPGHDKRYAINSDKITNELNWMPNQDFESGLKITVQWYAENIDSSLYDIERIGKG